MTIRELYQLIALLVKFRCAFAWRTGRDNRDRFEVVASDTIRAARLVIRHGGSYRHPMFEVKATEGK